MTTVHQRNEVLKVTVIESLSTGNAVRDAQLKLDRVGGTKALYFIGEQQVFKRVVDDLRNQYRVQEEDPYLLPETSHTYVDNVVVTKIKTNQYLYFFDPTTNEPVDLRNRVTCPPEPAPESS